MRDIESLDFSKKHFIQVEFNFGVLRAGRIILSLKRQGKDFTKYSNDYLEGLMWTDRQDSQMYLHKLSTIKPLTVAKGEEVADYIPEGVGTITGIVSVYNGTVQLYLRDRNDVGRFRIKE